MTGGEAGFVAGATYWPGRLGPYWWEAPAFQTAPGELELAAQAGLTRLHLSLPWAGFQPFDERIPAPPMRALEQLLDLADRLGVSYVLRLLPVGWNGLVWLPSWLTEPDPEASIPVVINRDVVRRLPRDLFGDARAVNAARRLVREVTSAFDAHPAVAAWVLGDRLSAAVRSPGSDALTGWVAEMADTARRSGARRPLRHGLSARDLVLQGNVDIHDLAALGITLEIAADWRPAWAHAQPGVWESFLAAYAGVLADTPAAVGDVPIGDETAPAAERLIRAVHDAAGSGIVAATLFTFDAVLRRVSPFRTRPEVLAAGLLRADGMPTAAGGAWIEAAAAGLSVRRLPKLRAPDPDVRRRRPEATAREWYAAWVA